MRRVAGELGVKAMSLYNHIAGKDALLDGMLERVLDEVALPTAGRDWEAELRRCGALAARCDPPASLGLRPCDGTGGVPVGARRARPLHRSNPPDVREAGFTAEQAYHGYHALDGHTLGITMWELGHTVADQSRVEDARRQIAAGDYPYLLEHSREHDADHQSAFAFGLDLVFDGLRHMHDT